MYKRQPLPFSFANLTVFVFFFFFSLGAPPPESLLVLWELGFDLADEDDDSVCCRDSRRADPDPDPVAFFFLDAVVADVVAGVSMDAVVLSSVLSSPSPSELPPDTDDDDEPDPVPDDDTLSLLLSLSLSLSLSESESESDPESEPDDDDEGGVVVDLDLVCFSLFALWSSGDAEWLLPDSRDSSSESSCIVSAKKARGKKYG